MDNHVTAKGRLVFPALFAPKKDKASGKESYQATLLFSKSEEMKDIMNATKSAAMDAFGRFDDTIKKPFKTEKRPEKLAKFPFLENMIIVNFKTSFPPVLMTPDKKPITERSVLYAGCFVHISYKPFVWTNPTNGKGVGLNIYSVLKIAEGDKLGMAVGSEFDTILGSTTLGEGQSDDLDAMFN